MKKRILAFLLVAAMVASMTACSNDSGTKAPDSSSAKDEQTSKDGAEPTKHGTCEDEGCVWDAYTPYKETITFTKGLQKSTGTENFPEGDTYINNDHTRYVKETVNVQPEIAWETDANNYDQKVSLSIAAKDIPDIMVIGTNKRSVFQQLVDNELIWDMTDVYEKCASPFIKEQFDSFGPRLIKEVTRDGKMMAIPGTQLTGQHDLLWVRKDWLTKLNLEVPKTVEDIEKVAQAFIEKDPGGNGAGKTVGMTIAENVVGTYNGHHATHSLFGIYDAWPKQWIERDGKVVYGSVQPQMKDALLKLNDWYKKGVLDKEFAVRKGADREALVSGGQLGMLFAPWWGWGGIPDSVTNNKDAEWTIVPAPIGEDGNMHIYSQDPINGILVVSKAFKHPEAIVKALNAGQDILRGNGAGEEAYTEQITTSPNLNWGVTPVPLQIGYEDSLKKNVDDLAAALEAKDPSVMKYKGFDFVYEAVMREKENPKADVFNWQEALIRTEGMTAATIENIKTEMVSYYGTTETMVTKQANLDKLEVDMMLKVIMGEKPIEEFDKFVEQWKKMGGDEITAEVQAEVDAMK